MKRNYLPWKRPEGLYPKRDGLYIAVVPTAAAQPGAVAVRRASGARRIRQASAIALEHDLERRSRRRTRAGSR